MVSNLVSIVSDQIEKSFIALKDRNKELCKEIIEKDDYIDNYSMDLERECLETIATQNPKAEHLRIISAILLQILILREWLTIVLILLK